MKLNDSLKEKPKIIREMITTWKKVQENNIYDRGEEVPYDSMEYYEKWLMLKEDLINLKTKIHKKNSEIIHLIVRLSECKDTLTRLKSLKCYHGVQVMESGRRGEMNEVSMVSDISLLERDNWIKELELEIISIQNQIGEYNHKTNM
jgi:hypothetical protein